MNSPESDGLDAVGDDSDASEKRYLETLTQLGLDESGSDAEIIMPLSADTNEEKRAMQELVDEELHRIAIEGKEHQEAEEMVQHVKSGARVKFRLALEDAKCRVLHPSENNAKAMAFRHNQHLIAKRFCGNAVRYSRLGDEKCQQRLEELRKMAKDFGFFLFSYSEVEMMRRLSNAYPSGHPQYLIIDAGAKHPDPSSEFHEKGVRAADCHIQLPAPRRDANLVFEAPGENDEIKNPDWVEEVLQKKPYSIASIDDIQCDRRMAQLRLASIAMETGLNSIIDRINPERVGFEIEHVTAAIATLQGVVCPDGEEIRLERDLGITPIGNGRSEYVFEHFDHDRKRWSHFDTAYILKNRLYPVQLTKNPDDPPYQLIVDWWMKHSRLKKQ